MIDLQKKIISMQMNKIDEIIYQYIKENVPFKRELTKGRLKWHGIKLAQHANTFNGTISFDLLQRGKKIAPTLEIVINNYKII